MSGPPPDNARFKRHTPGSMCFRVQGTPLLLSGDTQR